MYFIRYTMDNNFKDGFAYISKGSENPYLDKRKFPGFVFYPFEAGSDELHSLHSSLCHKLPWLECLLWDQFSVALHWIHCGVYCFDHVSNWPLGSATIEFAKETRFSKEIENLPSLFPLDSPCDDPERISIVSFSKSSS